MQWFCVTFALSAPSFSAAENASAGTSDDSFENVVAPFVKEYCAKCHGEKRQRAGLDLEVYRSAASVTPARKTWAKVLMMLREHKMPPEKSSQPSAAQRIDVANWIERELAKFQCSNEVDPGRVTVRRLNRTEYNNTVRDLLGVDVRPAEQFPDDDVGYGFDNIGDVLAVSALLAENYLDAADTLVERATQLDTATRFFVCEGDDPEACARRFIEHFGLRAYRRPLLNREKERLIALFRQSITDGASYSEAIQTVTKAFLVAPHFLFRLERSTERATGNENSSSTVRFVGDFELATRLSYFIWSSMPDDELLELAERGELRNPEIVDAQALRMLSDQKSTALVKNFVEQWLQIRRLESATPDPQAFPFFDEELREAMRTETLLFAEAIMRDDRSVLEFIDADFTYANERLARHYGLDGISGESFRRVALGRRERGGVLTQASILTITSNPTRTSPVARGKWILEQILGAPPPPPPPNVEELEETREAILSGTLRERMERHRADPNCATCHVEMDALGFSLENFDAVGAWRRFDGKSLIDSTGELPDGRTFEGPRELKNLLMERRDGFTQALAEKMLTYALGRGLEYYDACAVEEVVRRLRAQQDRFSGLILGIVHSRPFRYTRAAD